MLMLFRSKSKPYLRMGEVHLVRIDVPWLPRYKLVYVNGGAGDYPCSLHCLSEWTTAKVPVLQMKIEGGDEVHPHIVAQYRRHSLPAVSEQAIDPTKTTVYSSDVEYPTFCCSEPVRMNQRPCLMSPTPPLSARAWHLRLRNPRPRLRGNAPACRTLCPAPRMPRRWHTSTRLCTPPSRCSPRMDSCAVHQVRLGATTACEFRPAHVGDLTVS